MDLKNTTVSVIPVKAGIYNLTGVDSLFQGNDTRSVIVTLEASQLKNINSGSHLTEENYTTVSVIFMGITHRTICV